VIFIIIFAILVILAVLYLYLIMPGKDNEITPLMGWYYAHRGLHSLRDGIPENTLAAFKRAVEGNYGMELDIRLTKDKQVVVFHDSNLNRACGINKRVEEMSYEELRNHGLFNTEHNIPLLKDVLNIVSGKVPLIIELKSIKNYSELCKELITTLKDYKGVYCIESFDPRIVKWFRVNKPHIIRGQLAYKMYKDKNRPFVPTDYFLAYLLVNFISRPDFIAYGHEDAGSLSFIICRKIFKAKTVAWTVTRREDMESLCKLFDLFIFEDFIP
jgi:glycerophosphoryl diester phosphodiesterase